MSVRSLTPPWVLAFLFGLSITFVPVAVLAQGGGDSGPDIIEWSLGQSLSDLLKDTIFPDGEPGNPNHPGPPFTPGTIGDIASNFPKDLGGPIGGSCAPDCSGGAGPADPNAPQPTQVVPESGATLLIAIGALFVVVVFGAPRRVADALGLPVRWQLGRSGR